MEKFIGLDGHLSSCTFGVMGPSGKRLGLDTVETNEKALVEYVQRIAGRLHLCLEEGTMSQWLYEILSPHVEDIVVKAQSKRNYGNKNDRLDALELADQLRIGAIKTKVFKGYGQFRRLREVSKAYSKVVKDLVRTDNRLKSLYRSRGISTPGGNVYSSRQRKQYLDKLPDATRLAAEIGYAQYDAMSIIKKEAEKKLREESKRHPIIRILKTCPGLADVRVPQAVAIIVTPHRFRTKRQLWSYFGLGIVTRSSNDYVQLPNGRWVWAKVPQTRGLNKKSNHMLKNIFKGAATTVIAENSKYRQLRQEYLRLISEGTKPNLAKLTIARKIAAIFLAMWKSEEVYDPKKHRRHE